MKNCKVCLKQFQQRNSLQVACSPKCALSIAKVKEAEKLAKAELSDLRERKAKLKTKAQHAKEAQQAFNAYIRLRDIELPCISCQRHHKGQYHAGHYLSVGARPNLRFYLDNVHAQCAPCNNHLSGNLVNYRIGLIERIGENRVTELEQDHEPKRYTIEQLESIKAHYRKLVKDIKINSFANQ